MKAKLLMLFMILSFAGYSQSLVVSGQVTDENGDTVPGASVLLKGTTQGVMTDVNGKFTIQNVPTDGTLIFSFIGYTTQEVSVAGRTSIDVVFQTDTKSLDEVVVVGYGTTTAKELTGAVSVIKGESITSLNPVRLDQALQGQVSGVQISTASGSPGGGLNIRIRGLSTNGNNNPLIIVDGIQYPVEGLNALNPSDVESINVLKDATAGIYGVRAANGVIIITTKQGKRNGRPTFQFDAYEGVQQTTKKIDLLNAHEYAIIKNEAFASGGQTPPFTNVNIGKGTDWQDVIMGNAPIRNYNLSISGGSEKSNYSIGGSYLDQEGIIGGDKSTFKRYNARLNQTTDISPNLKFQTVLLFTNEQRKTVPEGSIASVLYNAMNASPVASVYDETRDPLIKDRHTWLEEFSDIINPVAQIANTYNEGIANKIVGKPELTYKINNSLEVTGRIGFEYTNVRSKTFNPLVYYGSGKAQNSTTSPYLVPDSLVMFSKQIAGQLAEYKVARNNNVSETKTTYFNYNPEVYLNYNHTFNEHHNVKGTLGTSFLQESGESVTGTAFNIPYNSIDFADISAADPNHPLNNTSSWQSRNRLASLFGRIEYGYQSKYLISVLLRRDGSSRFGANNRFGTFGSASAAWVVTDESFFNIKNIDFLKIRASYGVVGNDKIGDFRYRALLNGEGVYAFNDQLVNGIAIGAFSNPDLKWETTAQTNIGADLTVWNGKIDISLDYYVKKTKDLLFTPDISAIVGTYGAGGSPPVVNGGDVKNSGFEFSINYNDQIGDNFKFNIGYNLTTIKNRVTALPQGVDFYEFGSFSVGGGTATRMQVGYPIGYFFGYKTNGVYQTAEEITERGITQAGAQPGDLRFVDKSGDGNINFSDDSDKTMIGSAIPDVIMGINAGAQYKGFDLSLLLYASMGNDILRNYERQQPLANNLSYVMGRWTGPGSTNEHPRVTTAPNRNGIMSDYFVEDGSFLRIKNIQLGYSLPISISEKIHAKRLRVYVAANNLATFTKYKGYNPDFNTGSPLDGGVDLGYYPLAKSYMVGLNLTF